MISNENAALLYALMGITNKIYTEDPIFIKINSLFSRIPLHIQDGFFPFIKKDTYIEKHLMKNEFLPIDNLDKAISTYLKRTAEKIWAKYNVPIKSSAFLEKILWFSEKISDLRVSEIDSFFIDKSDFTKYTKKLEDGSKELLFDQDELELLSRAGLQYYARIGRDEEKPVLLGIIEKDMQDIYTKKYLIHNPPEEK